MAEILRKILRKPVVVEIAGLAGSSIDRNEKLGQFPQRVQLGGNSVGWYEDEIIDWLESRPRGPIPEPTHATHASQKARAARASDSGNLKSAA